MNRDDPMSVLVRAAGGMLGWSGLLPLSLFLGIWLGGSISQGRIATAREVVPLVFVSILMAPFVPRLIAAWLASFVLGGLAVRSESGWSRLWGPAGIMATWVLVFTVRWGTAMGGLF